MTQQTSDTVMVSSHMEDYLEAIAFIKQQQGVVRVTDISRLLQVKTPSVTGALSTLSSQGLVIHQRYGYVDLTARGEKIALRVKRRHEMIVRFLTGILGVEEKAASEQACKMEHAMSPDTFQRFSRFIECVEQYAEAGQVQWLQQLKDCSFQEKVDHAKKSRRTRNR